MTFVLYLIVMSTTLRDELTSLLNRYSVENGCSTPDFILAQFIADSLAAFEASTNARDKWYGRAINQVPRRSRICMDPSCMNDSDHAAH